MREGAGNDPGQASSVVGPGKRAQVSSQVRKVPEVDPGVDGTHVGEDPAVVNRDEQERKRD